MDELLPLAVDLDGTLIPGDALHEGVVGAVRLGALVGLGRGLLGGRAAFKRVVAGVGGFDAAALPYDEGVVAWLRGERARGRRLGLFTAADQSIANAVAGHLGLFEVVRGSDGGVNLAGVAKAAAIEAAWGPRWAYAGDGAADLPVFARAEAVVLVGRRVEWLRVRLGAGAVVERVFPRARAGVGVWARALRLRDWVKNVLVFVAPLLGLHSVGELGRAVLLFGLMGAVASATYLVNDLLDLAADRAHPVKRHRPLAAGAIGVRAAVLMAAGLGGGALLASAALLPWGVTWVLAGYVAGTLLYSLVLKRMPMVDVTALAGLFTVRILAGNALQGGQGGVISPWLLTFSMLFFLGLAATKRYAEVHRVAGAGGSARGYGATDLPLLLVAGVGAGLSAIVIFIVYLVAEQYPQATYTHPGLLWAVMPLLLVWTLRLWHRCVHGQMGEDPIGFAFRDRFSQVVGVMVLWVVALARVWP